MKWWWPALAGALATIIVQQFVPTGWWLNSGEGVLLTTSLIAVLSLLSAFLPGLIWPRIITIALGSLAGSTIMLARTGGPGNLGPIVPMVAGVLALMAAAVGGGVGMLLTRKV
jgi:hypothetical protein